MDERRGASLCYSSKQRVHGPQKTGENEAQATGHGRTGTKM